jgi:hypothetical protein
MSTAGQQLFFQISAGLWNVLERYRSQAAIKLALLSPEPGFPDPRLLTAIRPDDIVTGDPGPGVSSLIKGIGQVLPNLVPGAPVTLHGFDPAAVQPAVLALVTDRSPMAAVLIRGFQQVLPKVASGASAALRSILPWS